MRRRLWLLGFSAPLWATPVAASDALDELPETEAELELNGGLHVAYGAGGSFMPTAHPPGFRHHLEAALVLGPGYEEKCFSANSVVGCWSPITGLLFGTSGLWGLGDSPSDVLGDMGYGSTTGLTAAGGFLEAGTRLSDGAAPVVGLRANVHVMFINVGVRAAGGF